MDRPGAGAVELRPVDRDLFRTLLRRQASTVAVVTAPGLVANRHLPALPPAGFTATSFTSVSLDPPPGDHTIVLGEPLALGTGEGGDPLVHHRGDHTTTFGTWPSPW